MSAPEIAVLIGIIAVFTIFAAVLAWVSTAQSTPPSKPAAVPARAASRARTEGWFGTSSNGVGSEGNKTAA